MFSWSDGEVISGRERLWPTTSAAGRRPSRPIRAGPVTNAVSDVRGLPDAGLRGRRQSHPNVSAFGTRACADGRRAAPPSEGGGTETSATPAGITCAVRAAVFLEANCADRRPADRRCRPPMADAGERCRPPTANAAHRWPMPATDGRCRPPTADAAHRWPMPATDGRCRPPMPATDGQCRPPTADAARRCRRPMQATDDRCRRRRAMLLAN